MQSEHLSNLHAGWVIGGWLIAASVTAGLYLGGVGLGLVQPGQGAAVWIGVSMGGGFFVGGMLVGMRWSDAPLLHGAAITFFSVLVWFVVTLTVESGGVESVRLVLGLVLLQFVASCSGAWMGRRVTLGGTSRETGR
ncbi:MAG: hypothetical protein OEO79_02700 [Gemmatimonadota bacterium]|nr:hypothetical protein [Gemmatimonadota bacterium]